MNRTTLYRWLADDTFKREMDAAQRALVQTAARRLTNGLEKSVTTALDLAEKSEDEPTRLRAALAIPGMLRELTEHYELSDRIRKLEEAVETND